MLSITYLGDRLYGVMELEISGDRIQGLRLVTNPDKLRHLAR